MATSSASNSTEESDQQDEVDTEERLLQNMGWKALFSFTTRRHIPILVLGVVAAAITALTLPALAIMYGLMFREFGVIAKGNKSGTEFLKEISTYCLYITALGGISWAGNSLYYAAFITFGFGALLRKDMAWYDTRDTGVAALLPAMQTQIHDLQMAVSQPSGLALECLVQAISALGVAFYSSWSLTLVIICTVPIMSLVTTYLSSLLAKRAHEQSDVLQQALKHLTNAVRSIETVKCFNGERNELQRYGKIAALAGSLYNKQANFRALQLGTIQFFPLSVFFQGFFYGSHQIFQGQIKSNQVITTFWAAMMAVQGVTEFLPQYIVLQKGKVAGARLRVLVAQMSKASAMTETMGHQVPARCEGKIEFHYLIEKVKFSYPSRVNSVALRDVSISFPTGKTTFVIGKSGSGKSTLGQLLVRFYQPASGQIRLDGNSLQDLDVHWLRRQITLVEQHSVLFNESIRRNIALGQLNQEVRSTTMHEVISFVMLHQLRQRLALARARLRDSPVLILDESTSALDYITTSSILQSIRSWRRGRTTIVITHDITQILPEDSVYVMDKAKVVQHGTRRMIEAVPFSPFYNFLNDREQNVPDESDAEEPDDDRDTLMYLYEDSWSRPRAPPRPSTAVLRRSGLFPPFRSPGAIDVPSRGSRIFEDDSAEITTTFAVKLPPSELGVSKREARSSFQDTSRPLSVTSLQSTGASRLTSQKGPSSFAMPPSVDFPRPMSLAKEEPSFRKTFRAKMERRKRKQFKKGISPESLAEKFSIIAILRTVWPLLDWTTRMAVTAGLFCSLIYSIATPAFGYVLSQLFATLYSLRDQRALAQKYVLSILGIAVADGLATYGFNFFFEFAAQKWVTALRTESLKRTLQQPRSFFGREENSVARLAECLDQFAEEARNLPGRFFCTLLIMVLTALIALVWALVICWKFVFVAVGCMAVMFFITRIFHAISTRWENFSNDVIDKVGKVSHETFVNIRTVRWLVLEDYFRKRHAAAISDTLAVGTKRAIYTGSIYGLNYASAAFVTVFLMWWGAYLVSKGEFTLTDIITALNVLMLSVAHVAHIAHIGFYIPQINVSKDAASRIMRLMSVPQDSKELVGTQQLFSAGDTAFDNVNFAYPTRMNHKVLRNVSLDIPKGSCTAIVGTSGSGKSTIAALLLKLYQTGTKPSRFNPDISISRQDIKTLHTLTLRSCIAIVSQTPVLFPSTINVCAAAFAAGCDDFIDSLPSGYRTLVGDGGTGFSGGQAQRIAIARAFVRSPDILILDEATSALDVESARLVRDTVQRLVRESKRDPVWPERVDNTSKATKRLSARISQMQARKGMTVLVITHAREMMRVCEQVIMLENGRVVEEGEYEHLRR
ncbi:ABC a-pheromone efflux pump AtrD [Bimuria novae-zelandiae CBS 107.79]|uniref:ABC a-pheromone efflux pump AtrD n=1 Tax=Bimuria novae-zelandiae CBS 107.79 TaxID=1447943 RepID=A0A6A5UP62_9PLEO|nr:ABC a-pheromone efflux pump AtrD [Bimuria novae-zelandiae CBS 107.79]